MRRIRSAMVAACLAMFAIAATNTGCSDDDSNPTGNNNTGGTNPGQTSQALDAVYKQYFVANQGLFLSLEFFGPLMGTAIAGPVAPRNPATPYGAMQSCIDPALQGKVFDYVGSAYVPTEDPGAPAEGVRFILYEVDPTGQVDTTNEIGYVDVECAGSLPTLDLTVTAVVGGQTRFSATIDGNYTPASFVVNLDGNVYDGSGVSLPIGGLAQAPYDIAGFTNTTWSTLGIEAGTLRCGINLFEDKDTGGTYTYLAAAKITTVVEWEVYAEMVANASDDITSGHATYSDGFSFLTVACIGGTLDAPTLTDPAVGGCTQEGSVNGTYPLGSTQDLVASYQLLAAMHETVWSMMEASLGTLPAP